MLQCITVCCCVLQRVAPCNLLPWSVNLVRCLGVVVCQSELQHAAACFSVSQCVLLYPHREAHYNTLQYATTRCNALQHAAARYNTLQRATTHCSTLQHAATHYITLQHATTRCNALQHAVTRCTTVMVRSLQILVGVRVYYLALCNAFLATLLLPRGAL